MVERTDTAHINSVVALIAGYNLVQNLFLQERGYVAGNLVVSALLVGMGRAAGLSSRDLGLSPGDLRRGIRLASLASGAAAAASAVALSHAGSRRWLIDERAKPRELREVWWRVLVRFPLGTALFEEIAFRGVLPGVLRDSRGPMGSELISAALFAGWHLIPTGRALTGNETAQTLTATRRMVAVVSGSLAAGAAGLLFSSMRAATGSLLAPWLAHSAANASSYLAGVIAARSTRASRPHGQPAP